MVIVVACYARTLRYDFVFDDPMLFVENPKTLAYNDLPHFFVQNAWAHTGLRTRYYRPLLIVPLMVMRLMFGTSTTAFHAFAIAIYEACVLIFFFWFRRLLRNDLAALAATLLFALHPMHLEAVAWVTGTAEPLSTGLMALAFLSCIRAWESREHGTAWYVTSAAIYMASLWTKETAVLVLFYLFAFRLLAWDGAISHEYANSSEEQSSSSAEAESGGWWRTRPWKAAAIAVLPLAVVWPIYFALRAYSLSGVPNPGPSQYPANVVVGTAVWALWSYLKLLVWPAHVAYFYDVYYVPAFQGSLFWMPFLSLIVVALALTLWMRRSSRRDRSVILFALIWSVVPILPTFNLSLFWYHDFFHDRYAFMATAGTIAIAMVACQQIGRAVGESSSSRRILTAASVVAIISMSLFYWRSIQRESPYWVNNMTFFRHAMDTAPKGGELAMTNLADYLTSHGQPDKAVSVFEEIARRLPNSWTANYNLANVYLRLGRGPEALPYAKRSLQLHTKDNAQQYVVFAASEMQSGDFSAARAAIREALENNPQDAKFQAQGPQWFQFIDREQSRAVARSAAQPK